MGKCAKEREAVTASNVHPVDHEGGTRFGCNLSVASRGATAFIAFKTLVRHACSNATCIYIDDQIDLLICAQRLCGYYDPKMQVEDLSDDALVTQMAAACRAERRLIADIVGFLVEVEDRRLDLRSGCSSLFDYCVRSLEMSEGTAFRRINAARLVRRFPCLLACLPACQARAWRASSLGIGSPPGLLHE